MRASASRTWPGRSAVVLCAACALFSAEHASARPPLSPETKAALERFRSGDPDAFEDVGAAEEYAEVAAIMSDVLGEKNHGLHNNACLALEVLIQRHPDLHVAVEPVLDCITHRVWTCQQKGAQVIRDALSKDEKWLAGREDEAIRRLIPLTASQRSRVYDAALACLERLTKQKLGRDPLKWASWYDKGHDRKLSLEGCVFEVVAVVDIRSGYALNGEKVKDAGGLETKLKALAGEARKLGLALSAVVVVDGEVLQSGDMQKIQAAVGEVMTAIKGAGLDGMTISPPDDRFLPPVRELLPKAK
ncbi:hypothetical protein HY251_01260 [bacterium]|nr:hypothetical protein [bacterium]